MSKIVTLFILLLSLSGCAPTLQQAPSVKPDPQYISYKTYDEDVLPKLESGYKIIGNYEKIIKADNLVPEYFINKARNKNADVVMVGIVFEENNYVYYIYYLKKLNIQNAIFGAELVKMPKTIRHEFGSNKGCALGIIYKNTPAFYNDLFTNDVIVKANHIEINSCNHFKKVIEHSSVIQLEIWSNGDTFTIDSLQLNI